MTYEISETTVTMINFSALPFSPIFSSPNYGPDSSPPPDFLLSAPGTVTQSQAVIRIGQGVLVYLDDVSLSRDLKQRDLHGIKPSLLESL